MAGSGGGVTSYLPVAAALAATVMTDGAAAPLLTESLGATGAAAATGAGIGAITGGGVAALTGQDIGKNALLGGLGGAALGYGGLYQGAADLAAGAPTATSVGGAAVSPTVAGAETSGIAAGSQAVPLGTQSALGVEGGSLGTLTPAQISQGVASGQIPIETANAYGQAYTNAFSGTPANAVLGAPGTGTAPMGFGTKAALGGLGLAGVIGADNKRYGIPSTTPYTGGNLSTFSYNPYNYRPDVVRPPNPVYQARYAQGGLAMGGPANVDFMGGDMYPQSQIQRSYYATPTQAPTSAQAAMASYEPKTNPLTGEPTANMRGGGTPKDAMKDLMGSRDAINKYMSQYSQSPSKVVSAAQDGDYNAMLALNAIKKTPGMNYASGGIASLGSYSDGGRMLKGPGDGMSDSIPAKINGKQPARLADGEFVVPADVVSHIGNGSTDAGAKKLYAMMNKVRKARTGKQKQAPAINASKYVPV